LNHISILYLQIIKQYLLHNIELINICRVATLPRMRQDKIWIRKNLSQDINFSW
jgi:hypothetical protein